MKPFDQMSLWDHLEIAIRRRWLILLSFLMIAGISTVYSLLSPNIYRAETLILVQPQKVPEAYIKSTVTSPINERLRTISQQIMSRTMLERIINELDLYKEERISITMEEVVEKMRKDIDLKVKGRHSFQLFFEGKERSVVATVVNKLASLFIEENLIVREQHAEGTTEFLEMELERIRNELESREEAIKNFKNKHMGELPGQLDANLRILDRLQLQLQSNSEALRAAEDRKILLIEKGMDVVPSISPDTKLGVLKRELLNLEARYTGKHPEVVRVRKEIQDLEARIKEGKTPEDEKSVEGDSSDPLYQDLSSPLIALNLEIRRLKREENRIEKQILKYQKMVENIPKHEQELSILTRDYENIKRNYQSLLNKKLEAQLASNMERKQKGEQFKVLDSARIPEKPYKPNRQKILLFGMILGLGIGGGLAYMLEYIDHSFRDIKELEKFTKLPVIASVPKILTKEEIKRKEIKKKIVYASSLGIIVVLIATATIHLFVFRLDFMVNELSYVRKVLWPQ
ncbi:MAG: XrtA system polysaccharide chain length determinant [Thermodesulfobacteriota bacterium]|nr:XrtA system polysaccharide chain length determinant [Thermodesulfobacteriota bacterium]